MVSLPEFFFKKNLSTDTPSLRKQAHNTLNKTNIRLFYQTKQWEQITNFFKQTLL